MNPLLSETLVSLTQVAKRCPTGRGDGPSHCAHRTTVLRWVTKGVTVAGVRVKLEAVRTGGRWVTSEEAFARFTTACGAACGVVPVVRSPAATRRASERAEREIDKLLKGAR